MNKFSFHIRPVDIWWLGVWLFAPSCLIWAFMLGWGIYDGWFPPPFDRFHIIGIYLPLFAALVGLIFPVICLRRLRHASWRQSLCVFAVYLVVLFTWGIIDVRNENYQMGGHFYPNGPLIDGHKYYFHNYYTWYFLPYRWIEQGIKDYPEDEAYLPSPADPNK
jgi:hypothetical protein